MKLNILNSKQAKEFREKLKKQFGFSDILDYAFLKSNKGKIYAVTKDVSLIDYDELRIDSMGMYFAEDLKEQIRLSIEGSQIIGPKAKKNFFELNDAEFKAWFKGEDIDIPQEIHGFQIMKHKKDFFGCGSASQGKLRNFLPKTRRITSEML